MNSNYKRLGDYIRTVDVKNKGLISTDLRGVNYQKFFMPSVANIVGVDLSKYKLIRKGQFACNLMHVGRDECLPVALHRGENPIIVSPAYYAFEIIDSSLLLDEYLFLLLKRKEFDREAWFYTDADVRSGLIKTSFLDMMLPVPPIEEQRRIVAEYQAIEKRIENNRRLIDKLEQTAQTIYRKMFVDDIDPQNLPEGWRMGTLDEISQLRVGGDKPSKFSPVKSSDFMIPIYANGLVDEGICGYTDKAIINVPAITISARGTIGKCFIRLNPYYPIVRLVSVIPINHQNIYYLYFHLQSLNLQGDGSVQSQLTIPFLLSEKILIPSDCEMNHFANYCKPIYLNIQTIQCEILVLEELQSLLQTRLPFIKEER